MSSLKLAAKLGLSENNLPVFFILTDAFLWYYLNLNTIAAVAANSEIDYLSLASVNALGVIIAAMLGLLFASNRRKLLFFWTLLGSMTPFLPFLSSLAALPYFQVVSFVWGFSFGLGMPSCLGFFAENVKIENRGRFSGLALFVAFSGAVIISEFAKVFDVWALFLSLSILRLLGFVPLLNLNIEKRSLKWTRNMVASVFSKRLYLFLIPWFTFNIIDLLEGLLLRNLVKDQFSEYYVLIQLISLLFLGVFVFLGGLCSDLFGRKPVIVFGFAIMGIAYAVVSIVPHVLFAWFFFSICEGLALGSFYTVFIAVIWGDLALEGSKELYYFVGSLPFFLATILQLPLASYMMLLSETSAFSLAAFFLFLTVLPILFAPETLPEKKILERQVKDYVEKAKKLKDKYT
jgi:MFS family permease